jgi:hypothetical protein
MKLGSFTYTGNKKMHPLAGASLYMKELITGSYAIADMFGTRFG